MTADVTEKLNLIRTQDPDGAARLENLMGKREALLGGNVYGERFTERQFSLVFTPLLEAAYERACILEVLSRVGDTVPGLSEKIGFSKEVVFGHLKELMRKNLVEIGEHSGQNALFRKK